MNLRRFGIVVPFVLSFLMASPCWSPAEAQVGVNQPAPDFKLPLISGGEMSLSQHRGKVVVVEFSASW